MNGAPTESGLRGRVLVVATDLGTDTATDLATDAATDLARVTFSERVRGEVIRALTLSGRTVDVVDLDEDGFEPCMTRAERLAYESADPILDPMVRDYADRVALADGFVFVFPTRNGGLPAITKGWLERVLVPGVGFALDPRTNTVRRGLTRVRRIVGITVVADAHHGPDGARRTLLRSVRAMASVWCRTDWISADGSTASTAAQQRAFLDRIHQCLLR